MTYAYKNTNTKTKPFCGGFYIFFGGVPIFLMREYVKIFIYLLF